MLQVFWLLAILSIVISGFFESHFIRCMTAAVLMTIALYMIRQANKKIGVVEKPKDEFEGEPNAERMRHEKKKIYKKYDKLLHKYLTLETLSKNQQSINWTLDVELTRMQDMMRFLLMNGRPGLSEAEANALIDKTKKDHIDGVGMMNYLAKQIRIKAERRARRRRKTNLRPNNRLIDLG